MDPQESDGGYSMKKIWKLIAMPPVTAAAACVLFFLVSLIPQSAIQENASRAAKELVAQPQHVTVLNIGDPAYQMDNYTDSQIILQSYNLTIANPASILSNPKHISGTNSTNMALALDEVVNQGAENETNYVRYWMGFRIFIRPLLLVGSYFTIRKIVAAVFWVLLFAAMIAIAKKVNTKTAMCFGISLALLNPSIIAQSLQYSCTFLLTFVFILYLCCCRQSKYIRPAFSFCAFGVLTQLFDFYTTPVITWGIPVLLFLTMDTGNPRPLRTLLKTGLAWLYGYGAMWLTKLLTVTLFTDINGLADGFYRLAQRVGIVVMEEAADKYDAIAALKAVWKTVFPGTGGKVILGAVILVTLVGMGVLWHKRGWKVFWKDGALLIAAAVPVAWFLCSAQPTYIHAWFQHRSLIVMFFGLLLFYLRAGERILPLLRQRAPGLPE